MTTRINGQEYHGWVSPSEKISKSKQGGYCEIKSRQYTYHEDIFRNLDSYLATDPGSEEAEGAVRKIRNGL